jgi:hypothetical protein
MKTKTFWTTKTAEEYSEKREWAKFPSVAEEKSNNLKVVQMLSDKGFSYVHVEKESQCGFNFDTLTVSADNQLSSVLHEAGHAVLAHQSAWNAEKKMVRYDKKELYHDEIAAWDAGYEIMKQLDIHCSNYAIYADECLETYYQEL